MAYVIAEIGSSPAPKWDFAHWVGWVRFTGAPAVKAQLFRGTHFPPGEQRQKTALEFPRHRWGEFVSKAHDSGLRAGASVFDVDALRQVLDHGGDFIKVAAREQTNASLLATIATEQQRAQRRIPVYRSVSDPRVLRRGYPFDLGDVILLTIPQYPASLSHALLRVCYAASALSDRAWGWSSHTANVLDCWLAVKLGAALIEKHLVVGATDLEARHSLLPGEFRKMVEGVK